MATEVALKLTADGSQASNSVKSIKQQLREAQAEVVRMSEKFGETSTQAAEAAKKAAELKDRIGDAKSLTDAFNPDAKFQAFGSALQGVVGGFAALQGAQALFGAESEDLQKVLTKVQGAMALTQGLNAITAAKDSFKQLGVVVMDTFRKMSAATLATGIGLLIAAVALLISKWDDLFGKASAAKVAQDELNKSLEAYTDGTKNAIAETNKVSNAFELAKKGVITKEQALKTYNDTLGDSFGKTNDLNKAEKLFTDKAQTYIKIQGLKAQANALFAKSAEYAAKSAEEAARGEQTKKDIENLDKIFITGANTAKLKGEVDKNVLDIQKSNTQISNSLQEQAKKNLEEIENLSKSANIATDFQIEKNKSLEKSNKDAGKKSDDAAKKRQTDRSAEIEREKQQTKDANAAQNELQKKLQDDITLSLITNERKRAEVKLEMDLEAAKKDIENGKATASEKAESIALLERQYMINLQQMKDKFAAEDKDKADKQLEEDKAKKQKQLTDEAALDLQRANNQDLTFDERLQAVKEREDAINTIVFESEAAKTEYEKQNADARIKIAQDEAAQKIATTKAIGDAMGQLSEIIGKETAVGKGLAVAQATINTWLGATEVLRAKTALPEPVATISKIVNVAAIVASGIKSVKSILATKVPGGGGGGGTPPSLPQINAPLTPQTQSTLLNQGQVNQLASATSRAFVLESDVSGSQERIKRINRAARIN
jgi:hypothetical protein